MTRLLFIGDIVGKPARVFIKEHLPLIVQKHSVDIVLANAENAAGGAGITANIANELKSYGVDGITLGDHVWDQRGFELEISTLDFVCRPANLPNTCPGKTFLHIQKNDTHIIVLSLLGRQFMHPKVTCPFLEAQAYIEQLKHQAHAFIVEIHAEATSEKVALGWFLDGKVSAVVGSHTHIPTADAQILPKGTAYITDLGMTGPYDSVLGREKEPVIQKFLDGLPRRFPVAQNNVRLSGVLLDIDKDSGLATRCEHIWHPK